MQTIISVNTMQSGYVYVGASYQYKTLTEAFAANKFQVIIPDEYIMEDTLVFNKDIIYSLTILDEIKINKLNINTDGTGLYIVFDGIGLVTFTSSNPFVYMDSTTGLALYFNSTRINSTVPFSIDATFIQASNTRFASDFPLSFCKFSTTSGIISLNSCQFGSDLTLLDLISANSYTVECISCRFSKLLIKATKELPTDPGTYTAYITLSTCIIEDLYLEPDGTKILTPNINIIGSGLLNISSDLMNPCTLYTSNITNTAIANTNTLFPNLYYSNIIGSIIEDPIEIRNSEFSSMSNNLFNDNVTITIGIDSTIITGNIFTDTLSIASAEDSNIAYNTISTLDIGVLNRCSIQSNTINNGLTTQTLLDSNITYNTLSALSSVNVTNTNITGHKNILMELDNITNSNIESNIGLQFESQSCLGTSIISNVLNSDITITSGDNITFSNNSTIGGEYALNTNTLDRFVLNSNRLVNPNINIATDGCIVSNIYRSNTIGLSTNVTIIGNTII